MSYRIQTIEKDLSGFLNGTIDEIGAMLLYSPKGRMDKPILCYTEDQVIAQTGYPSSSYPSVFEALSFVKKAPLYIISPYGQFSLFGGVDVRSGSVVAFAGGRPHPDSFVYTSSNKQGTQTIGTSNGVSRDFTGILSNVPISQGYLRIKVGSNYINGTDFASGVIAGTAIDSGGTNTINYNTGAVSFRLGTVPTSGTLVVAEYQYKESISAYTSHSFFACSPYTDDLAISIQSLTGVQFKLLLYKKSGSVYNQIDEVTYSLNKEKDGSGKSLYILDAFKDQGLEARTAALDPFAERDRIKAGLAAALARRNSADWMEAFIQADIWAAPVLDWRELVASGMMETLDMLQDVQRGDVRLKTTRLPIKIDGHRPADNRAAPVLGDANALLSKGWGNG